MFSFTKMSFLQKQEEKLVSSCSYQERKQVVQTNNKNLANWKEIGKVRMMPSKPYLKSEEVKLHKTYSNKDGNYFSITISSSSSVKSGILDFRGLKLMNIILTKSLRKNHEQIVKDISGLEIKIFSNKKTNSVFMGINETSIVLTLAAAEDLRNLIAKEIKRK